MQPNGKVLKNSAWETGIFETKEDGRKMYSQKIRFDYNKGETKRCNFSVIADNYPKGNYTFQIYHNGVLIANTVKTLS
jgi:glutathionyl-hydroquinone reductase